MNDTDIKKNCCVQYLNINVKANGITSGAIVRKERAKDWVSSNIFNFFPKINE